MNIDLLVALEEKSRIIGGIFSGPRPSVQNFKAIHSIATETLYYSLEGWTDRSTSS